jgi:hypothetical protein
MKKVFSSCAVLFLVWFFCITKPDHFCPEMLQKTLWKKKTTFDFPEIYEIAKEPLTFIGNGLESIAFVSADNKYVVKFFLNKEFTKKTYFKPKKRIKQLLGKGHKAKKPIAVAERYREALQHLPEETALLAVHTHATTEKLPKCNLVDYRGKEYVIDLNDYIFVIQKRAEVIKKAVLNSMSPEEISAISTQLSLLFQEISQKGFINTSLIFNPLNFALLDGRAIMIDLGKLTYCPEEAYSKEESRFQTRYAKWLGTTPTKKKL